MEHIETLYRRNIISTDELFKNLNDILNEVIKQPKKINIQHQISN